MSSVVNGRNDDSTSNGTPVDDHASQGDRTSSTPGRDPVEELAAEFSERLRDGKRVSVEQYAKQHPDLADEIRELFPTIVAMEQLSTRRQRERGVPDGPAPQQFGDYRIIGEIARGGMGIVHEAEQVSLGRRVAVKVLPTHALRREKDVRRFQREAQTAAGLHHSNIVPVFGVGEEGGQRYIVMQLIRGVGLDEVLREIRSEVITEAGNEETRVTTSRVTVAKRSAHDLLESELKLNATSIGDEADTVEGAIVADGEKPASVRPLIVQSPIGNEYFRNVARVGLQAANALHYAHKNNTLHRDIKPGNLLLDDDGRIWIADFGLAKALQDDDVTCSGDIVGTMAYVAPERFRGETTRLSDIYSLGVTLHEMLTLQKAFDGEDRVAVMNQVTNHSLPHPSKINKAVPRDLETIVLKAASQHPRDRYESAASLADDLQAFLDGRPIMARPLSQVEHAVRWCNNNRGMSALMATVVVLIASVIATLVFGYQHADHERQRAEQISKAAVGALDEIYNRFAITPLTGSLGDAEVDTELGELNTSQMPISKDVALLLDNLLAFYDELSVQTRDSDEVTVKYIAANRRVGDINRRLGQLEDARSSYRTAIQSIDGLDSLLRDTTTMRLETARVHNGMGLTFRFDGRHAKDQVQSHERAVSILDHEAATDEEKFELATSLYLLYGAEWHQQFSSRRHRGDRQKLDTVHLDRAADILADLKRKNPRRADYDLWIARCLLTRHRSGEGRQAARVQAIEILEGLIEQFPENPDYQYELGNLYYSIEKWNGWKSRWREFDEERLALSEANLRKGLEATLGLEIQHPNIPQYYLLKKQLYENLGDVLRVQERFAEAEGQIERSMQMQRMLIEGAEEPESHKPWLYELQVKYGKVIAENDRPERARDVLTSAIDQLESLVEDRSQRDGNRYEVRRFRENCRRLKSGYIAMTTVLTALGDDEGSKKMFKKAECLEK